MLGPPQGELKRFPLEDFRDEIRVTQFMFGRPRVESLKKKFDKMTLEEIKYAIAYRRIPCIIGPKGHCYMFDRHHFSRAVFEYKPKAYERWGQEGVDGLDMHVEAFNLEDYVELLRERGRLPAGFNLADYDLSHKRQFRQALHKLKLAYTNVEDGSSLPLEHIPHDPMGLQESYYRGMAWVIREVGAFEKTDIPFAEFFWGDFLRDKMKLAVSKKVYSEENVRLSIKTAVNYSRKTGAKATPEDRLPGAISTEGLSKEERKKLIDEMTAKATKMLKKLGMLQ